MHTRYPIALARAVMDKSPYVMMAGPGAEAFGARVGLEQSGEYFIRLGVAREISNLVAFKGMAVQQAADEVIHHELEALDGDLGVIALTPDGRMAFSLNTPGMFRARLSEGGKLEVHFYKDEQ